MGAKLQKGKITVIEVTPHLQPRHTEEHNMPNSEAAEDRSSQLRTGNFGYMKRWTEPALYQWFRLNS